MRSVAIEVLVCLVRWQKGLARLFLALTLAGLCFSPPNATSIWATTAENHLQLGVVIDFWSPAQNTEEMRFASRQPEVSASPTLSTANLQRVVPVRYVTDQASGSGYIRLNRECGWVTIETGQGVEMG